MIGVFILTVNPCLPPSLPPPPPPPSYKKTRTKTFKIVDRIMQFMNIRIQYLVINVLLSHQMPKINKSILITGIHGYLHWICSWASSIGCCAFPSPCDVATAPCRWDPRNICNYVK